MISFSLACDLAKTHFLLRALEVKVSSSAPSSVSAHPSDSPHRSSCRACQEPDSILGTKEITVNEADTVLVSSTGELTAQKGERAEIKPVILK